MKRIAIRSFIIGPFIASVVLTGQLLRSDYSVSNFVGASTLQRGMITIDYPLSESIFPPEFLPPTFLWREADDRATTWAIDIQFGDGAPHMQLKSAGERMRVGEIDPRCVSSTNQLPQLTAEQAEAHTWTPGQAVWDNIKAHSVNCWATITIAGYQGEKSGRVVSRGQVTVQTSRDPVGAPIFYRDVPLMPSELQKGVIKPLAPTSVPLIGWRLRNIAEPGSRLLMDGVYTCANCHSFSRDGKTLGLDVDGPANDKGLYALVDVKPHTSIRNEDVIKWSTFQGPLGGNLRATFMPQVSPDGQYVLTTIDNHAPEARDATRKIQDRYYVANFKDYRFLQVFFPTHGLLAWYSKGTGHLQTLPGSDDPRYVQANGVWSPDGEFIVFARAEATDPYPEGTQLAEFANDPRETQVQFDLYRIPFNEGKGGIAQPIAGASHNGLSNSFPKISPDGRWLVFVKARNGLLMRPDSQLYIVPVEGGTARRMRCNTPLMNSWHSFSPSGRWMVFSSKSRSPYTQMFLTHIDEQGNDSPAILIENSTAANRAVNLPEFVNISPDQFLTLNSPASELYRVLDLATEFSQKKQYAAALQEWKTALALSPDDAKINNNLGATLAKCGRLEEAVPYFEKGFLLDPENAEAHINLAAIYLQMTKINEAVVQGQAALKIDPKNPEAHSLYAIALDKAGEVDEAIPHYFAALAADPDSVRFQYNLGAALQKKGRFKEAIPLLKKALISNPDALDINYALGRALVDDGQYAEAIPHLEKVLAANPNSAELHFRFGILLTKTGKCAEAIPHFEEAQKGGLNTADLHYHLGMSYYSCGGKTAKAIEQWREATRLDPNNIQVLSQMARVMAADSNRSVRDGQQAIALAERAANLSERQDPVILDTLAMAYAEARRYSDAVQTARVALLLAKKLGNSSLALSLESRITSYESH